MGFVTDTHSLIWYFTGDERLSKTARGVFFYLEKGKGHLIISVIVFLETLVLVEKARVRFSWAEFNTRIANFPNAVINSVDKAVLQEIPNINPKLELHDRVLAATAKLHKIPLISKDTKLAKTEGIKIIW